MRDAAGEFDDFLAAGDFAEGVGDDLAVLGGDDFGELALAGVEQLTELEQHLGALGQRGVTPGGERGGGGVDHGAGVLDTGERDLTGARLIGFLRKRERSAPAGGGRSMKCSVLRTGMTFSTGRANSRIFLVESRLIL